MKPMKHKKKPLLTKLEKLMAHWTSNGSDKVVYATVNGGQPMMLGVIYFN